MVRSNPKNSLNKVADLCPRYLAILTVMEAVGLPNVLPVFDLSSRVFPKKDKDVSHKV
jgi:hypothetical protein